MAEETLKRKLTAILYADVAEYSRLTGNDEAGTHRQLRAALDLISETIEAYEGTVVHYAGDAVLADFTSVVAALECAVKIQDTLETGHPGLPNEQRLRFRMGVNLGEVIVDREDIYGDGVNVAARLESLAEPGGICISASVHEQVQGKLDIGFEFLGDKDVKNIDKPVPVYRVLDGSETAVEAASQTAVGTKTKGSNKMFALVAGALAVVAISGMVFWNSTKQETPKPPTAEAPSTALSERPSVAVLPFLNMSDEKEQEYFSDGMSEDLITDLSKVSGLDVVARNSSFAYKGQSVNVRDIGRDLNVRYVIEGSVRKAGGHVRINAQLIDATTGNHVWADRFDKEYKNVFALQDEVVARIVQALKVSLTPKDKQRLAKHETENTEAYDWYLRGLRQESFFSKEGNEESRRMFHRAVELDPNFSSAYGNLGQAYSLANENGWRDEALKQEFADKALAYGKKAVELDPDSPLAHWSLGRIATRPPIRDVELALASLKRTIELDPNYGDGYAFFANILNYVGRADEAIPLLRKAMKVNPRYPFWYVYLVGQAQYLLKDFEAAAPNFKTAIERNPNVPWPHRWLAATYGQLGMIDDAEWELSELNSMGQVTTIKKVRERIPIVHQPYLDLYLDGLRKAGVPEE